MKSTITLKPTATVLPNTAARRGKLPLILEGNLQGLRACVTDTTKSMRPDLADDFIDLAIAELQSMKHEDGNAAKH
jgi:hypothetical protein